MKTTIQYATRTSEETQQLQQQLQQQHLGSNYNFAGKIYGIGLKYPRLYDVYITRYRTCIMTARDAYEYLHIIYLMFVFILCACILSCLLAIYTLFCVCMLYSDGERMFMFVSVDV